MVDLKQCDQPRRGNNNNNNQAFYFQVSWGRLERKPHEKKNRNKTRAKKEGETKGDKNQIKKKKKR
jgi:hypothetical protein